MSGTPGLETTPPLSPTTLVTEPPVDAAPAASEPGVPVTLTAEAIKFPEDFSVADDVRDEFLGIMNNAEMEPGARAQSLIDLQAKLMREASEAGSRTWDELQTTWQDEVKADPEIGGPKLESTLLGIGKLVQEYGTPELREAFNITGAGNNPHVIRFLSKISAVLSEGRPVSGTPPAAPRSTADKIYGG